MSLIEAASLTVFGMSLAVLVFAAWNLVHAIRQNRTNRWTLLRARVYLSRALDSQREAEQSTNKLLRRLKESDQ